MGGGGGETVSDSISFTISFVKQKIYGMQSSLYITRDKYYTCINDWFVKVALFT